MIQPQLQIKSTQEKSITQDVAFLTPQKKKKKKPKTNQHRPLYDQSTKPKPVCQKISHLSPFFTNKKTEHSAGSLGSKRAEALTHQPHLVLLLPLEALRLFRVLSLPRSFSLDSLVAPLSLERSLDFSSERSLRLVGEGALDSEGECEMTCPLG